MFKTSLKESGTNHFGDSKLSHQEKVVLMDSKLIKVRPNWCRHWIWNKTLMQKYNPIFERGNTQILKIPDLEI